MQIGPWQFEFPLYLAPMAGVTDQVFRKLCKRFGADVVVTEFVSGEGIFRRNARTVRYLSFDACERPIGVQLFGADPDHMAEATRQVIEWKQPDFIDLNFGCPVNKVVAKNGGSALLKDCPLLERVTRAVVAAAGSTPVTAKIRIGWNRESVNACETARILEGSGIHAITVHGRTRDQGYAGEADWETIRRVAESVVVPVIGNGDIDSAAVALERKSLTPVAGLMLGRAAMSHPWIFSEIKAALADSPIPPPPSAATRWEFILEFVRLESEAHGGDPVIPHLRSRLIALTKGMPGAKQIRESLAQTRTIEELRSLATKFS